MRKLRLNRNDRRTDFAVRVAAAPSQEDREHDRDDYNSKITDEHEHHTRITVGELRRNLFLRSWISRIAKQRGNRFVSGQIIARKRLTCNCSAIARFR